MPANSIDNRLAIIEDSILNGTLRDERVIVQRYIEAIRLIDDSIEPVKAGTVQNNLRSQLLVLFGCRRSVTNGPDDKLDSLLKELLQHVTRELPAVGTAELEQELYARMPEGSLLLA